MVRRSAQSAPHSKIPTRPAVFDKCQRCVRAVSLQDLRVSPGNRLEELKRDRKGQHSIRIDDQRRIYFVWRDGDAFDIEIADY